MSEGLSKSFRSFVGQASGFMFLLNCGMIAYVVRCILAERAQFGDLFTEVDIDVPLPTRMLLDVAAWAIYGVALAVFLLLAVKEFLLPWRTIRLTVNVAAFVGLAIGLEVFRQSMLAPLLDLLDRLAH